MADGSNHTVIYSVGQWYENWMVRDNGEDRGQGLVSDSHGETKDKETAAGCATQRCLMHDN